MSFIIFHLNFHDKKMQKGNYSLKKKPCSVVVLHHQANAGRQPEVVVHPCKPSDLARYRGWFEVAGLAAHHQYRQT